MSAEDHERISPKSVPEVSAEDQDRIRHKSVPEVSAQDRDRIMTGRKSGAQFFKSFEHDTLPHEAGSGTWPHTAGTRTWALQSTRTAHDAKIVDSFVFDNFLSDMYILNFSIVSMVQKW